MQASQSSIAQWGTAIQPYFNRSLTGKLKAQCSVELMGPSFESFGIWILGLDDRGDLNFEREEPGALASVHFQVPG